MKHLAVFHLNETIWLTDVLLDSDLKRKLQRTFMVNTTVNLLEEHPVFQSYAFECTSSKMYEGNAGPYMIHHYALESELNKNALLNELDLKADNEPASN